jgi:anaerobic selenocysteine-containing dehydrogenase
VHLSDKAVDPPGEARSDLDIFVDFARRMGLKDKDGQPLVTWSTPEEAFDAWRECSRGRPCDYSGLSYEKLRGASGIQWPCTEAAPDGTERLYEGGVFWAAPDECETYGRDLETGAPVEAGEYRALNPFGRAVIKAADYRPAHELPDEAHPLQLITGRTVYHFHTRTRTGRAPELQAAAPEVWVEVSAHDAHTFGLREGDLVEVRTRRGEVRARVRVSGIRPGVAFLPFHYGYWDTELGHRPGEHGRAANELTPTMWDPASKQPIFKTAACSVRKVADGDGTPAPAPDIAASARVSAETTEGASR